MSIHLIQSHSKQDRSVNMSQVDHYKDRLVVVFSFPLNTFSFVAVVSKTSSHARDQQGVYTQNSKMTA